MQLPKDIATKFKTPMYINGITITDEKNIAVRLTKEKGDYMVWYFDEEQIYRKISLSTMIKKNLKIDCIRYGRYKNGELYAHIFQTKEIFKPRKEWRNSLLDTMLFSRLSEGDHATKLIELASITYLKSRPGDENYTEFERKFQKIEKPLFIGPDNVFDYIKIYVDCSTDITKEDVAKNKKELDRLVLTYLENYRTFRKFNVPITALALSKLVLTKDKRLEYTFEIKKELRELLQ